MDKVYIFVEGIADQVFLKDVISCHFNHNLKKQVIGKEVMYSSDSIEILSTGGWTKINQQVNIDYFLANSKGVNLLIFDADESRVQRADEIRGLLNEKNVTNFEMFFSSDEEGTGDLETMLIEIMEPFRKAEFFACFNPLEECLNQIEGFGKLTIPNRKAKVFSFASTFLPDSKNQQKKAVEANRNYNDENLWDLQHEFLNPLIDFLRIHLQ